MPYLLDTNILLRLIRPSDPQHQLIVDAVQRLVQRQEQLFYTSQNLMEFWCVCGRPGTSRGGFGFSPAQTERAALQIERAYSLLPDMPAVHVEWRRLVVQHRVRGVQVHDAHLVASMHVHGVRDLLTLNTADFKRYPQVNPMHPSAV